MAEEKSGSQKKVIAPVLETLINRNIKIRGELNQKRQHDESKLPSLQNSVRINSVIDSRGGIIDGFVNSLRK